MVINLGTEAHQLHPLITTNFTVSKKDLSNRAGSNPAKKNVQKPYLAGFCSYPFEQFNIDPNGNVSICCADSFLVVEWVM